MGTIALIPAFRKRHGRISCLALFVAGFLCLLLRRHAGLTAMCSEPIVTALGASLIIGAHLLNLKFSKACNCCDPVSQATGQEPGAESCPRQNG
jgi:hypothetical protein